MENSLNLSDLDHVKNWIKNNYQVQRISIFSSLKKPTLRLPTLLVLDNNYLQSNLINLIEIIHRPIPNETQDSFTLHLSLKDSRVLSIFVSKNNVDTIVASLELLVSIFNANVDTVARIIQSFDAYSSMESSEEEYSDEMSSTSSRSTRTYSSTSTDDKQDYVNMRLKFIGYAQKNQNNDLLDFIRTDFVYNGTNWYKHAVQHNSIELFRYLRYFTSDPDPKIVPLMLELERKQFILDLIETSTEYDQKIINNLLSIPSSVFRLTIILDIIQKTNRFDAQIIDYFTKNVSDSFSTVIGTIKNIIVDRL